MNEERPSALWSINGIALADAHSEFGLKRMGRGAEDMNEEPSALWSINGAILKDVRDELLVNGVGKGSEAMSIKSSALFGPPIPCKYGERKAEQTRPGFHLHDLPEGRRDRPVMTEWRLSLWGRVRVLLTGRIITTVWCDKNPPMAVEHDWPNAEAHASETKEPIA